MSISEAGAAHGLPRDVRTRRCTGNAQSSLVGSLDGATCWLSES